MRGLDQRVLRRLRKMDPRHPPTIVVGFSGGTDSLALLAALSRTARSAGTRVLAAHVDHGLRAESMAEAEHAERLAASLGVPFQLHRLDRVRERHPGVGLEEAARRERYLALATAVDQTDGGFLALGHHQQDQAETVLLHLLRGAGIRGAAAMAEYSPTTVPWWSDAVETPRTVSLWRLLLDEPRSTLATYVAALGLSPNHDPSNDDRSFGRNAIRHDVLPLLEQVRPGAGAALARYAALAADDDRALEAVAYHRLATRARLSDGGLLAAPVVGTMRSLARRMVRHWLVQTGDVEPTFDRVEAVIELARSNSGGRRIEVGGGRVVRLAEGALRFEPRVEASDEEGTLR